MGAGEWATPAPTRAVGTSSHAANGELAPGTVINAGNAHAFARYLAAASNLAVAHGFVMNVLPSRHVQWSDGFEKATEKYSPQVTLDEHDHLQNYIAGAPFPLIDVTDPKAAVKIAYDWHMGPFMPDDFSIAPWSSNAYGADRGDPATLVSLQDHDYSCEQFEFLRFAHRTEIDPRPTLGGGGLGVEWKARCTQWNLASGDADNGEGAGIWVRHLSADSPDDFYAFSESSRRLRRMSVGLAAPNAPCRSCHQPYWAYALPKTEIYNYRLLGTTSLLACLQARDEPAGIAPEGGGYRLTGEPAELRQAYILEMTPANDDPQIRTIVYVDSELFLWLAAEFYQGQERTAVAVPLWRMHPAPEGGSLFDLAGSFYFPLGQPVLLRSLVPAGGAFTQKINTGDLSEGEFNPNSLVR
ncbi:MAG TPA: hypothetical protein VEJ86_04035 [Candidatus Binataceae bacterium]|nr:hypothetical protein [Candidatus Binataceae bacterium]